MMTGQLRVTESRAKLVRIPTSTRFLDDSWHSAFVIQKT
jgi:hypothetical protein